MVPSSKVGGLIGKGGESIRNIRSQSGCNVKIASIQETGPGATERVVTLRGSLQSVQIANQLIQGRLNSTDERGRSIVSLLVCF